MTMRTKLQTTNIKGKEYVEVNTRIQYFRENKAYEGWSLETEIIEMTEHVITMRAVIKDQNERIIATGMAFEKADSSYINKTSYIENCETSAWGRALGNLGIGIKTSIASKEEVENAIHQQKPKGATIDVNAVYDNGDHHKKYLIGVFKKLGITDRDEMKYLAGVVEENKCLLKNLESMVTDLKNLTMEQG